MQIYQQPRIGIVEKDLHDVPLILSCALPVWGILAAPLTYELLLPWERVGVGCIDPFSAASEIPSRSGCVSARSIRGFFTNLFEEGVSGLRV